jgi:regulator of protease activity HflC (stomatin/prohibitin superfamily)
MGFIILGLILFGASYTLRSMPNPSVARLGGVARVAGIAVIGLGLLTSCIKQIDAGMVGVQKLFGKVNDNILESGLNFVNPLVEVVPLSIQTRNYTMSAVHDEGDKSGDDAVRVMSSDGLELTIDLTVLYKVNQQEAPRIIREVGRNIEDVIVRPITRTKLRDNAVYYAAVDLYSSRREEFQARIFRDLDSLFRTRGLTLEQLLLRNIALPESVKASIESKINAEQEAQKMQYVLQKEKQEAERKRVEAQGIADYQRILSQGLSDKMLQYEQIKAQRELATSQNAKVIIMNGKSAPILIGQ